MRKLLLGDEAIAQAAIDSGLSGVYAYPGTPSTEITEFIQLREEKRGDAENKICCRWATNEKTAMEGALGMSYMGKRALVCMKHVGMNVAADPFVNSAMTGVNGGLVVVAADDPSMHSSQNEQDSRFYGKFAMMPIFEPSNQQEAYEMTRAAFELSEAVKLPVLMRVTTRMAHSRAVVNVTEEPRKQNEISRPEDVRRWILLPAFAKKRYVELLAQQDDLQKASVESKYNFYRKGTNPERGVICTGIAYNYYMENAANCQERSVLKISQYPLPIELIEKMVADGAKELYITLYVESLTSVNHVENHHIDIPLALDFSMDFSITPKSGLFSLNNKPTVTLMADFEYGDAEVELDPEVKLVDFEPDSQQARSINIVDLLYCLLRKQEPHVGIGGIEAYLQ